MPDVPDPPTPPVPRGEYFPGPAPPGSLRSDPEQRADVEERVWDPQLQSPPVLPQPKAGEIPGAGQLRTGETTGYQGQSRSSTPKNNNQY